MWIGKDGKKFPHIPPSTQIPSLHVFMIRKRKIAMTAGIFIIVLAVSLAAVAFMFVNPKSFGHLPDGERLARIRQSPHYRNGAFRNLEPTQVMASDKGRLRTMLEFLFADSRDLRPENPIPAIRTNLKNLSPTTDCLVWFGHSSYLLQLHGRRFLVDPVFYQASPVSFINKAFPGTEIYRPTDMPPIDFLVITHDHWDHLDYRTVTELKDKVDKVICPLGVGEHFEYWGYDHDRLIELDWKESAELVPDSSFTVHCLPTRHFSGRGLTSNQTLWAAFLLCTPSLTVYTGGDGGYGSHFRETGKRFPHIDLALIENGQYNEDWRYIHLMPGYLGRAARELGTRYLVTVHHSKYALSRHRWDEPLLNERRAAKDYSLNLIVPQIGQMVRLDSLRASTPSR